MPICGAPLPLSPPRACRRTRIFGPCCGSSAISIRASTYAGSSRAGYVEDDAPGAGNEKGQHLPPLALDEIVTGPRSSAIVLALCFAELWSQSPTMLQPVGGMDAIVRAFVRRRSAA